MEEKSFQESFFEPFASDKSWLPKCVSAVVSFLLSVLRTCPYTQELLQAPEQQALAGISVAFYAGTVPKRPKAMQ